MKASDDIVVNFLLVAHQKALAKDMLVECDTQVGCAIPN